MLEETAFKLQPSDLSWTMCHKSQLTPNKQHDAWQLLVSNKGVAWPSEMGSAS